MLSWLSRMFGRPGSPSGPESARADTPRALAERGRELRPFDPSALSDAVVAALLEAFSADERIVAAWPHWVTGAGEPDELLVLVQLAERTPEALGALCERLDAVGIGSSMAQAQRGPLPASPPFYVRRTSV